MNSLNKVVPHFFLSLIVICLLSSCYALRAYKFRKLELMDHERMPFVTVEKSNQPYEYAKASAENYSQLKLWLDSNLQNTQTAAYVVIKNDSIIYQKYFDNYTEETLLPSFSVIKSYIGTLTGLALAEGKIKSLQQPVTDYIPELLKNDKRFANISLQHLLDMRSGIKWSEGSYGLKDDAIKMGFRPNIRKQLKKIKIESAPTDKEDYKSINTLLLGIVVTRATKVPLATYFQEKIWQPLGTAHNATLNTDKKGMPVTFAGLNATALDFAKFGSMYLHKGFWNGRQIIPEHWVNASTHADTLYKYDGYKNQFWGNNKITYYTDSLKGLTAFNDFKGFKNYSSILNKEGKKYFKLVTPSPIFNAEGILGQYIYVDPAKNIVVVRLGHNWSHPKYYAAQLIKLTMEKL